MQDTEGTREEADGLVSKCLLQDAGGGGYRVHDLVLDFVKIKVKADEEMVGKATALQAQYLGRLDVLESYDDRERSAGNQGFYILDSLWRSLENLSGDPGLEVVSYAASLGEMESCGATVEVATCLARVGYLHDLQVWQAFVVFVRMTGFRVVLACFLRSTLRGADDQSTSCPLLHSNWVCSEAFHDTLLATLACEMR